MPPKSTKEVLMQKAGTRKSMGAKIEGDKHCKKEMGGVKVVVEKPVEGLPQMNQTLFKRVASQNFFAMAESVEPV